MNLFRSMKEGFGYMGDASVNNERMRAKCYQDTDKIGLNNLDITKKELLCSGPYWKNTRQFGKKVAYVNAKYRNYKNEKINKLRSTSTPTEEQTLKALDEAIENIINPQDPAKLAARQRFRERRREVNPDAKSRQPQEPKYKEAEQPQEPKYKGAEQPQERQEPQGYEDEQKMWEEAFKELPPRSKQSSKSAFDPTERNKEEQEQIERDANYYDAIYNTDISEEPTDANCIGQNVRVKPCISSKSRRDQLTKLSNEIQKNASCDAETKKQLLAKFQLQNNLKTCDQHDPKYDPTSIKMDKAAIVNAIRNGVIIQGGSRRRRRGSRKKRKQTRRR